MKTFTMRNIPDNYFLWLKRKAEETGTTMTSVIKFMIRDELKKEQRREEKREI